MSIDALREQVEELQALAATFPEEGAVRYTQPEQAALALAEALIEASPSGQANSQPHELPQLSGALVLQDAVGSGQPVTLHFTLPADYPATAARLQVNCLCDRAHHDALTIVVQQAVEEAAGGGCLLLAASALQQAVAELLEQGTLQAGTGALQPAGSPDAAAAAGQTTICRTVIWFHHIKSVTKRKHIVQWAAELHLGGFSKPGFPGVIVCEGLAADVEEYVQRLRALKWQAMAVRGQEEDEVAGPDAAAAARQFSVSKFLELPERGMSQLAAACREAGMEDLFLAALKIVKS